MMATAMVTVHDTTKGEEGTLPTQSQNNNKIIKAIFFIDFLSLGI